MSDPEAFDPGGRFRAEVAAARLADPMPAMRNLARSLGLPVEQVVHFALTRWTSAGAEALLSGPPQVLLDLRDAAEAGDTERVRGIVAFLLSGFDGEPS